MYCAFSLKRIRVVSSFVSSTIFRLLNSSSPKLRTIFFWRSFDFGRSSTRIFSGDLRSNIAFEISFISELVSNGMPFLNKLILPSLNNLAIAHSKSSFMKPYGSRLT